MRAVLKGIDGFTRNIFLVFAGTSFVNLLSLFFQLLIAHAFSAADFAAFNALLAIFVVLAAPLGTLQIAVAKYCSEFKARSETPKIQSFLTDLFKKVTLGSLITFLVFWFISLRALQALKIPSQTSGYLLALLLAATWIVPVFLGAVQGLELFGWLTSASVISALLKLSCAFLFINLGYQISGAVGAMLIASVSAIVICFIPLRIFLTTKVIKRYVSYRSILSYILPVAVSYFCFNFLVSIDMVLVKYYFSGEDSGTYSLAQMIGKIFLFFPAAISAVLFPRASSLNAQNKDTRFILRKSLIYAFILCAAAFAIYNIFPQEVLRLLTGKVNTQSLALGRLFGISMSFFVALNILIFYFLSIKDLRFIPYLAAGTILQALAIVFLHQSLFSVQIILCVNSAILFIVLILLEAKRK